VDVAAALRIRANTCRVSGGAATVACMVTYRWPRNLPGTLPGDPMPPLLAVRAFLGLYAGLEHFDAEVEAALQDAAATGDFQELREAVAAGLWCAICAEHVEEIVHLPPAERGEILRGHMTRWLDEHRPPTFREWLASRPKPPPVPPAPPGAKPAYRWEFVEPGPDGMAQSGDET